MLRRSISVHLALMFALSALLIVSVIGILLRSSLHDSLQKQMHNELLFRESLMSPWITARTSADGWSLLANKFSVLTNSEGERVRYWIVSDNPRFSMGGTPPVGVQWSSLQEGFNKVPGASEGACSLFLLVKTIPANGERPELRYVVAIDSTPYMGTLDAFTRTLLIITALGVVIVALLGYVVSRIGLRPVGALSKQARQLAPGDHGQRLNTEALPDELQQLASSFNGVLERQEVAWRQLESFNADVAHELRTPLTNLIGQTQLGLSRRRSHDDLEELLGSNLEELERMTSIVNDMLFLSHAHAGEHASQLTQVSLREETLKTAEYVEPSFAEKQLSLDVQGDVTADIDRRLFHRSLANLLENSARHSPSNSTVTVRLSETGHQACVEVSNPGDPIAPEHLHRLFERFYRVDTSRARSDTHHGLGLSIVRAVAIMHRGDVFARSEGGINTFGLTFALQADKAADNAQSGTEPGPRLADRIVRGRQPDVITLPIKSSQAIPSSLIRTLCMIGHLRYLGLLLPFFTFSSWAAEQNPAVHIAPAGSQNAVFGPAENFTGRVRVDPLFKPDNDIPVSGAYVTFEPGARSAWHTHPAGQRLIVTSGVGLTQQEGQPMQVIRAGDVVSCPAGVKHWHGAAPGSAMTHLAITGVVDGKSVNWMEKVTDEQY
ncbi:hypothetical protein CWN54_03725, partial [Klebsiella pneumoniae]